MGTYKRSMEIDELRTPPEVAFTWRLKAGVITARGCGFISSLWYFIKKINQGGGEGILIQVNYNTSEKLKQRPSEAVTLIGLFLFRDYFETSVLTKVCWHKNYWFLLPAKCATDLLYPNPVILNQGQFWPSGDICQSLETFFCCHNWRGGCSWHLVGGDQRRW